MVAVRPIVPMMRMTMLGTRPCDRRGVCWPHPSRRQYHIHRKLRDIVASKLILDWSPEQISGWLKTQYPDDESLRVSHETIYRSLFLQTRGVLKKELLDQLRSKRRMRRSRHASASTRGAAWNKLWPRRSSASRSPSGTPTPSSSDRRSNLRSPVAGVASGLWCGSLRCCYERLLSCVA